MGVEEEFREMRKMISRMLQDAFDGKRSEPLVRGFAGKPAENAGPAKPRSPIPTPEAPSMPGPEIAMDEGEVSITFDLGDTTIAGVRTNLLGRLLYVDVEGPRPMRRVVHLPSDVDPGVRWTVHNGVLDLILPRAGRVIAPP
jgi:HSP20 family molecular chaperone IbpA